jgi:hypothetical protein
MVSIDLKTIWVLSILLLVIILLSSIRVCPKTKVTSIDPYYDVKYKENFNNSNVSASTNDYAALEQVIKKKHENTLNQHIYLMRQANEINNLEQNIKKVETLLSDVATYK